VLQQTVANFQVRCCTSQRLHQTRRGVHSCVQAAAAARVAGGHDIVGSARKGDGVSVICHLIADADGVNAQDVEWLPRTPLCPHSFSSFLCSKLILLLFFSQRTPLPFSAWNGHLEVCRLLLQCNADIEAKAYV
jgi:hypothetical protein